MGCPEAHFFSEFFENNTIAHFSWKIFAFVLPLAQPEPCTLEVSVRLYTTTFWPKNLAGHLFCASRIRIKPVMYPVPKHTSLNPCVGRALSPWKAPGLVEHTAPIGNLTAKKFTWNMPSNWWITVMATTHLTPPKNSMPCVRPTKTLNTIARPASN